MGGDFEEKICALIFSTIVEENISHFEKKLSHTLSYM